MRCVRLPPIERKSAQTISIGPITDPAGHAADIARIHNVAYANDAAFRPYSADEIAKVIRDDQLWIAYDSSRVVGYCRIEVESDLVWIEDIAVEPSNQSRGIGSTLLRHALEDCNVGVSRPAGLNVSSKNPSAICVYSRLGFTKNKEMKRFAAARSIVRNSHGFRGHAVSPR